MGLIMNTEYLAIGSAVLSLVLLVATIILLMRVISLEKVRKQFYSQSTERSMESILVDQNRLITTLNKELKKAEDKLEMLTEKNKNNFQKIGFIRFNPFDDAGGNISFVIALLDDHNNGIVLSSLHGREGTRVYAKAVKNGESESKLTEEEAKAIKDAK
jgi:hypothetical protein